MLSTSAAGDNQRIIRFAAFIDLIFLGFPWQTVRLPLDATMPRAQPQTPLTCNDDATVILTDRAPLTVVQMPLSSNDEATGCSPVASSMCSLN